MPSDKSWPCKSQASSTFLNGLAPEHLISFVAFVNGKTCLVFHFTFQVLISLLITTPLSQTHTKWACFVPGQMRAQHTYKSELIGKEWIWMFEFNYTSKTRIHFFLNTVHITDGASLLGTWPLPQVLGHLGEGADISTPVCLVFACALSNMPLSICFVCLHRQVVSTLEVLLSSVSHRILLEWLSASPFTPVLHSAGRKQLQTSISPSISVVSYWLTVKMPLVVVITNTLRYLCISPFAHIQILL